MEPSDINQKLFELAQQQNDIQSDVTNAVIDLSASVVKLVDGLVATHAQYEDWSKSERERFAADETARKAWEQRRADRVAIEDARYEEDRKRYERNEANHLARIEEDRKERNEFFERQTEWVRQHTELLSAIDANTRSVAATLSGLIDSPDAVSEYEWEQKSEAQWKSVNDANATMIESLGHIRKNGGKLLDRMFNLWSQGELRDGRTDHLVFAIWIFILANAAGLVLIIAILKGW